MKLVCVPKRVHPAPRVGAPTAVITVPTNSITTRYVPILSIVIVAGDAEFMAIPFDWASALAAVPKGFAAVSEDPEETIWPPNGPFPEEGNCGI
jgi:hypothetical protein